MTTVVQPSLFPPESDGALRGDVIERMARAYSLQRGWEAEHWDHATGPECGIIWETKSSIINDFRKAASKTLLQTSHKDVDRFIQHWYTIIDNAVEIDGGRHLLHVLLDEVVQLRVLLSALLMPNATGGEPQDNTAMPYIDFLRDSALDIKRKLAEIAGCACCEHQRGD